MLDKIEFLRRISDYFWRQTAPDGSLTCPKHKIEHTGKNVYAALIDAKLHTLTGDEQYFERARWRVLHTVERLGRDPEHGAWIFLPGRWAKRNMANSVIDGGACADVLCSFYLQYRDVLSTEESERILNAVHNHVDTYLKDAAVGKEVTNQRLWGATGVAAAWRVFDVPAWREAVLKSITRSLDEQNADGSFFYHSYATDYNIYPGINDLTSYYHSRHLAFVYYGLEQIGEPLDAYADALRRGAEFLLAIIHPDGLKEMRLETKRWYWESDYEVASNPFDIYALVKTHEYMGEARFLHYATLAYRQLVRHQLQDGGVTSHIGVQHNFQCRVFWNGHVAWLARVIERVPDGLAPEETKRSGKRLCWYFPDAGLVRMEGTKSAGIVRLGKRPMNICYGTLAGGGSVLYFGRADDNWVNHIYVPPWRAPADGNFLIWTKGEQGLYTRVRRFLRNNWDQLDIRRRLWIAWVEFRGGQCLFAMLYPLRHILQPFLDELRVVYGTQWCTTPEVELLDDGVRCITYPARRDGEPLEGVTVRREIRLVDDELRVAEHLTTTEHVFKILYLCPATARGLMWETSMRVKRRGSRLSFFPWQGPAELRLSYRL